MKYNFFVLSSIHTWWLPLGRVNAYRWNYLKRIHHFSTKLVPLSLFTVKEIRVFLEL